MVTLCPYLLSRFDQSTVELLLWYEAIFGKEMWKHVIVSTTFWSHSTEAATLRFERITENVPNNETKA